MPFRSALRAEPVLATQIIITRKWSGNKIGGAGLSLPQNSPKIQGFSCGFGGFASDFWGVSRKIHLVTVGTIGSEGEACASFVAEAAGTGTKGGAFT